MMEYVSIARTTVLMNWSTTNEFMLGKSLRQGDLIPPFLFITVIEALNLMLEKVEGLGLIGGIQY